LTHEEKGMAETRSSSVDELAARVPDGASVTLNKGEEADVPMALAMALVRRGVRGLHVVTLPTCAYPASGMMIDLLIGAGCVASVETSGISLHEVGAAPRFSQAVKAGTLKVLDATCPAVYAGLQAGAKGQPFAPLRGLIGSVSRATESSPSWQFKFPHLVENCRRVTERVRP
jgi:glutaconate CoA-transferase subunit A